ncbi:MAG: tetratricopeptide repeat protein [Gemmatimonadota bacterium]|nr:tetratricopeptide repeat protein [Gemmatimonadota bacterium]
MRRKLHRVRPGARIRLVVTALAAVGSAGCGDDSGSESGGSLAFPPPPPLSASAVARDDFSGAEACRECHAGEYAAWAGSTHGRAGGSAGPGVVIAPFDGRAIRFADATVIPRVRGGVHEFVVRQDDFPESIYRVDGVIGGGHMIGGGTQGFVSLAADGTERFLPWDWSRHESVWFCNTGSRLNQGWVPITREMRLRDCGDWPPLRPIGTAARFANCQECHGSQIGIRFDAEARIYRTEYTTLQVNCESCHGPARAHVEMARAGGWEPGGGIGLESLAYLDKDASLELCFRCHALKDVLREGYLPGDPLEEYFALKFPVLGDDPYTADARVRTFAYQATHLASACYLEGPMDCVSCHEPHGQGYWDTDRRALASPFDDGQCTSCHASKGVDPEAHTFHRAGSEGSRCVSCHMPYLQHPEVGPEIAFARSDHTIPVPRPTFDADLGIESACLQCHQDRSPARLQEQAGEWWGDLKPHRPLVEGQLAEYRARNVDEAAALLLAPGEADPLLQFQALARFVTGYLGPDDPALSREVVDRLRALAAGPDLDVRALALAALHWSRGNDPEVRPGLVDALRSAPSDAALRGRWKLALGFLGDRYRERGDTVRGAVAYRKTLEIAPGDPRVLHAMGLMYNQAGDFRRAEDAFRESLAADPDPSLTWVNLGVALAGRGEILQAVDAYGEALARNPHDALAHFNLGNAHQIRGNLREALDSYRAAVAADPGLGRGYFEVGRTYILLDEPEKALPFARRAVEFLPDHAASREMLRDLERAFGN